FDSAFVAEMRVAQASHFIEVGCGTGFYSRRLLQQLPDIRGVGYEISPASKAFTEGQVAAFGFADRYEVLLQDIADRDMASTQWLVCVEVLEHLEDPVAFLRLLRASLAPGGKAFITAALNAPHVDHIYLYVQSAEVEAQLEAAGFTLEQTFVGVAHPPRAPGLPVPLVAAYIVA
ncbi:MAG: class I SAM-dependent methyltransferase, partial [Frankiaceae bacterium]|nr:class I SAM-dependent methyltransferase [Frankiaceae bacterium]